MATAQDILLSTRSALARRTALKNIVRLIPAVVIIAATLNTLSCGSSGLLSPVNSGSASPTPTKTPGTGTLAFVTNYNDGKVSSFTRNITTGALKHTGQVTAGAKTGPRGVVASPRRQLSVRREYRRRQYLRVLDQFDQRHSDTAAHALDP